MTEPYWVRFKKRGAACVEAESPEAAKELGAQLSGDEATTATVLPYPAEPRLTHHLHTFSDGTQSECPAFCYRPNQCAGRTACPWRYACSE